MFVNLSDVAFERYDVIIAGTGPAGCVAADRLAGKGKRVLILDTGKDSFDPDIQNSFTKMRGSGHYDETWWPQHWLRVLGGTSTAWAGYCAPMDARDLEAWPIARADLDPYYDIAARIMKRDPIITQYREDAFAGFIFKPFSVESPVRFGAEYGPKFRSSDRVDVTLETTLAQLVPTENRRGLRAIKLYSSADGTMTEVPLRENQHVILAAGAMGNAQLLQAPVPGSNTGAGDENDMAGRCLMEHPHVYKAGRVLLANTSPLPTPPASFGTAHAALIPGDDVYRAIGERAVTIEFRLQSFNEGDGTERFIANRYGGEVQPYDLIIRSEMKPDPNNRAALTSSRDPAGLPRIEAVCAVGAQDLRAITGCLTALGEAMAREDIGRLRIDNDQIYRQLLGGGHTMGTTRMGDDPKSSVVDKNCTVHGYGNLHVAGSSVFTTGGASNPTLTIAALAARLADHLAEA